MKTTDDKVSFTTKLTDYLSQKDWRVTENSNVEYSIGGLILHNSGAVTADYYLNGIYSKEIREAHTSCAFHIHDLSMLSGYCTGWSLRQLIEEGLGGVKDKIFEKPAVHLRQLLSQITRFFFLLQNEWAGAQAFSSFDTYLAPFVKTDNLSEQEVYTELKYFIYEINTSLRWGSQQPFTNLTFDWTCPDDLKNQKAIVGAKEMSFTYGECQKEMDIINKAFINVMLEGDGEGRGFPYPIPTYNITKSFNWTSENTSLLFKLTSKYGTPYFQNFINSDLNPSDVRSMCCRLRLDKRELKKRGGGLFGSDEFTGSIGVVTINLPQIAYLAKTEHNSSEKYFYQRLDELMDLAKESLMTKRKIIQQLYDKDFYPYTKRYLKTFDNHFNTIGICGMNECCLNFFNEDLTSQRSRSFALNILEHMRSKLQDYQEATGQLFNLEATPAESTSYRLAKHDKENFPFIVTSSQEVPYYTNSSQLPVNYSSDVFDALDYQEELQTKYTGGTVFHIFTGEEISDYTNCAQLVKTVFTHYKVPYITVSPTYSICPDHGYLQGSQFTCPICGKETEVYSRIVGYYRPVSNWNKGKQEEFSQRRMFKINSDVNNSSRKDFSAQSVQPEKNISSEKNINYKATDISSSKSEITYEIYVRSGCSHCAQVKSFMKNFSNEKNISGKKIDVDVEQGFNLASQNLVVITPTVIFYNNQHEEISRCNSLEEVKGIIAQGIL